MAVHDDQWSNSPMVVNEELHLKQAEALLAIPDKICDRRSTVSGEFEFLGKKDFFAESGSQIWEQCWQMILSFFFLFSPVVA